MAMLTISQLALSATLAGIRAGCYDEVSNAIKCLLPQEQLIPVKGIEAIQKEVFRSSVSKQLNPRQTALFYEKFFDVITEQTVSTSFSGLSVEKIDPIPVESRRENVSQGDNTKDCRIGISTPSTSDVKKLSRSMCTRIRSEIETRARNKPLYYPRCTVLKCNACRSIAQSRRYSECTHSGSPCVPSKWYPHVSVKAFKRLHAAAVKGSNPSLHLPKAKEVRTSPQSSQSEDRAVHFSTARPGTPPQPGLPLNKSPDIKTFTAVTNKSDKRKSPRSQTQPPNKLAKVQPAQVRKTEAAKLPPICVRGKPWDYLLSSSAPCQNVAPDYSAERDRLALEYEARVRRQ